MLERLNGSKTLTFVSWNIWKNRLGPTTREAKEPADSAYTLCLRGHDYSVLACTTSQCELQPLSWTQCLISGETLENRSSRSPFFSHCLLFQESIHLGLQREYEDKLSHPTLQANKI
ncbi:hypothetical protein INR49_011210 [Caranx melampygus]|nr:hypothetical protein INR49_011210 [Caranx melampygus]